MEKLTCGILYNSNEETVIICPHCGSIQDERDMPDLFYEDSSNTEGMNDQAKLLRELQALNYNVVTCGNCGNVLITKRGS